MNNTNQQSIVLVNISDIVRKYWDIKLSSLQLSSWYPSPFEQYLLHIFNAWLN